MNLNTPNPAVELAERLRFETLLADLSSTFVNLPVGEVDCEIMAAQRRICELLDLDVSALWQWLDESADSLQITHLYRAQDGPPVPTQMEASEYFPWCQQNLRAGRIITVSSLATLPMEATRDRETWHHFGIKTSLTIPLLVGGRPPIGALSFNTTRVERDWPDTLVKRLQLLAQIFTNALARKRAEQEFRQNEKLMALAAEAAEFGVWDWNIAHNQIWGSEPWRRLFGFAAGDDVSFEMLIQRIHPNDRETVEQEVRHALVNGRLYAGEFRVLLPEGAMRWIASRGRGQKDASGKPVRMLGAATDITERKRTDEALRISEARLAVSADLAGLGCYEVDFADSSTFVDERFAAICGMPTGQQPGLERLQFWIERLHPDDRESVLEGRRQLHEGEIERYDVVYRFLHPVQGEKWIHHLGCVAARDTAGRVTRTYGVLRDITARKQLSAQLLSAAEEWQTTFDSINDLIMILDADQRIVRVNAATARFLDVPAADIVGNACCTLMHGSHCPIDGCPYLETLHTGQSSQLELFHAASGKWLLFSTDPIRDAADKIIGGVHVGRDVTQAKQAETELRQQREELAHIARVHTLGALSGSLAHELNQPLGIILSNAQAAQELLAQEPPDVAEVQAILTDIVAADRRAGEVIDRLRHFAQARPGVAATARAQHAHRGGVAPQPGRPHRTRAFTWMSNWLPICRQSGRSRYNSSNWCST